MTEKEPAADAEAGALRALAPSAALLVDMQEALRSDRLKLLWLRPSIRPCPINRAGLRLSERTIACSVMWERDGLNRRQGQPTRFYSIEI
jgi:hypothetical protein